MILLDSAGFVNISFRVLMLGVFFLPESTASILSVLFIRIYKYIVSAIFHANVHCNLSLIMLEFCLV